MDLNRKIEAFLESANEEEEKVLSQLLDGFEKKKENAYDYISGFMGIDGNLEKDGSFTVRMPVSKLTNNIIGTTHGGIIATLADDAMGFLVNQRLAPLKRKAVTSEMKLNYLSPGVGKELIAKASIIKGGTRLIVTECKIYNDAGDMVAMASAGFFVL